MKRSHRTRYVSVAAAILAAATSSCTPAKKTETFPADSPLKPVDASKQGEFVPPGQEGPEKRGK